MKSLDISSYLAAAEKHLSSDHKKKEIIRQMLGILDLTSLDGADNLTSIDMLCRKALSFGEKGLPLPAAVCVYPPFISLVKKKVGPAGIKTASVAGAFPSGQLPLQLKVAEVTYAVEQGADEIDMVISRGTFLAGDYNTVAMEISEIRRACGQAHLKVILETGELKSVENIMHASRIAIDAGADFIKTSTGKIQPAATPEAMIAMLLVIKEVFEKTGRKVGIKPAGGISTPEQALQYWLLTQEILGSEWLCPELFRIGASRLADALVVELGK